MTTLQFYEGLKPKLGLRMELKGEIADLRTELKGDISSLRTELKSDISGLEVKMGDFKSEINRWMSAIFITMMLAIIGLYLKR